MASATCGTEKPRPSHPLHILLSNFSLNARPVAGHMAVDYAIQPARSKTISTFLPRHQLPIEAPWKWLILHARMLIPLTTVKKLLMTNRKAGAIMQLEPYTTNSSTDWWFYLWQHVGIFQNTDTDIEGSWSNKDMMCEKYYKSQKKFT